MLTIGLPPAFSTSSYTAWSSGSAADSPSIVQTSPSATLVEWRTRICARAVTRGSLTADKLASSALGGPRRCAHRHERSMEAAVVGELGMEGDGEDAAVADRDRVTLYRGQDLDSLPVLLDPRCPDEHGAQRLFSEALDAQVLLEALQLAAERVAATDVVRDREVVPVADDHPGAAPQDGATGLVERRDRLVEALALHTHGDRRGLTAGNHQAVKANETVGRADLGCVRTKRLEHEAMGLEVALEGEDADSQPGQEPRP